MNVLRLGQHAKVKLKRLVSRAPGNLSVLHPINCAPKPMNLEKTQTSNEKTFLNDPKKIAKVHIFSLQAPIEWIKISTRPEP